MAKPTDGMELCAIETSDKKDKKYDARFREKGCPCNKTAPPECGKKEKIVSFGAKGMSDYTKHKDDERKKLYLARHKANEDWTDPMTPGALSRWILWNKKTLKASIADFKKRFNL
jgi:hypothetical protein